MRAFVALAFVVVEIAGGACVSLGEHEDLQRDHATTAQALTETRKKLDEEKQRNAKLDADLAILQNEHQKIEAAQKGLEEELARAQAQVKALESDYDHTRDQLAQTLKDRSRLSSSVDDMKRALDELARRKAEADQRIAEYKGLLGRFKTLIDAGKLKVRIVEGRMMVELATDILFGSGQATLSKEGKASVSEVAAVLTSIAGKRYQVEGHTDNVPIKTAQYPSNWELAAARALTVVKTMIDAGMPPDRVSAASFGDTKPATSNDTATSRAANRRIQIVIVPDLSSLPGFEELGRASNG